MAHRKRTIGWIVLCIALLGAVVGLVPRIVSRYSRETSWPAAAERFVFLVEHRGNEMHLTWERDSPVIAAATSGVLSIRDGATRQVILLSPAQLRDGGFLYTRHTGDVQVDLDVLTPAGKVSRTLMAVVPRSGPDSPGAAPAPSEPPAKTPGAMRSNSPSRWTYFEPLLTILSILTLAGLLRLRLSKKAGLAWAGLLGFVLVSWPPLEWLLSRPLENPYPVQLFRAPPGVEAIVVLAGGVDAAGDERPFPLPDLSTLGRCEFAAWIYRDHPELPVLASGGCEPHHLPFSVTMRELLRRAGVPEERIWTEERSSNTHENALYSADILRSRGIHKIVLVTEARTMLRAAACFRKEGLTVMPAPSAFRRWRSLSQEVFPGWPTIESNETTLHEFGGLIWYRLRGWI